MLVKRAAVFTATTIVAIATIGYLSNTTSAGTVEAEIQRECDTRIVQAVNLWRLPSRQIRRLPATAIRTRDVVTPKGARVTMQMLPSEIPPYTYAHAKTVAPFVLKVRYGWAAAEGRLAFGEGGERLVLSVFGLTKQLRDRPDWYL